MSIRQIKIENTILYNKEIQQKNTKVDCPLSFNGESCSSCVITCAWFRIEEKEAIPVTFAYCGNKLIGEIKQ